MQSFLEAFDTSVRNVGSVQKHHRIKDAQDGHKKEVAFPADGAVEFHVHFVRCQTLARTKAFVVQRGPNGSLLIVVS